MTDPALKPTSRTITLTNHPPVRIVDAEWPEVATAFATSYTGADPAYERTAARQGEVDTYTLIVRQHADGRVLVYGVRSAAIRAFGQPAAGESWRGGYLLQPTKNEHWAGVISAILSVAHDGGFPPRVARECIGDLPPAVI